MASFNQLKSNRKANSENLRNKIENANNKNGGADERFWKPTTDKAGNGYAVIRFLQPSAKDMELAEDSNEIAAPYITYYRHMFQINGKWFVNNCPTTIGDECPVCKANSELWATEIPANQEIVRKRKRQQKFVANILVIKDSKNPENEGKVFLFEFGAKIYKKIELAMFPPEEFEDEQPMDPFDFWEGANFKLKIRQVDGYSNYDSSEFEDSSPISENDEEIESIWKKSHSLREFIDPKNYKNYEKIEKEYNSVVNGRAAPATTAEDHDSDNAMPASMSGLAKRGKSMPDTGDGVSDDDIPFDTGTSKGDNSDIDYFQKMLND